MSATVIGALRQFLLRYLKSKPALNLAQRRAIWAIEHCRTPAMGGSLYTCQDCDHREFAYHSCNHRACPQCGRADTAQWVDNELNKSLNVPYFMVTFTLPAQLRSWLLGRHTKEAFDLFFAASSQALSETLASPKWLGAQQSGFTSILHTWNQRLQFHPHIHVIVPGAGIDANGKPVRVKNPNFLVPIAALNRVFRRHLKTAFAQKGWRPDPAAWHHEGGVNIQAFGNGENAIKYLGNDVCRTAISDHRILRVDDNTVTFQWKDRANNNRKRTETLTGEQFLARYLRHVLPRGLRSIRRYGYCHPAARKRREWLAFHTGKPLVIESIEKPLSLSSTPKCPCCQKPMRAILSIRPSWQKPPHRPP